MCRDWELRITRRALDDDFGLAADADFEDLLNVGIVKTFVGDRSTHSNGTRQVTPLTCGQEVWVLARGHDHRAATWFDEPNHVVWLVASGRHRSGRPSDFFPFCKALDEEDRLLPTEDDYERMIRDRDARFAYSITIEAQLVLKKARLEGGEHRVMFAGKYGACIAIEVAGDLEAIAVAFRVDSVDYDYVPIILSAIQPGKWEPTERMPSRELEAMEFAFGYLHAVGP